MGIGRIIVLVGMVLFALATDAVAVGFSSGGGNGLDLGSTVFPSLPYVGQVVVITDDSTAGACDSAAGTATTICRWNGSAWLKLGDGTAAGSILAGTAHRAITEGDLGAGELV